MKRRAQVKPCHIHCWLGIFILSFAMSSAQAAAQTSQPQTQVSTEAEVPQEKPGEGGEHSLEEDDLSLLEGAEIEDQEGEDVTEMDLEDLLDMEIEVTSVSRTAQRLLSAPSAVYVLTNEDIRDSGAQELPDALRMVPGMNVARISRGLWAISARGAASRFANKLQVLRDGRSIYSSIFSGTTWETQDFFLEDIERVEVIRGPGATVWGSNAVNGVINIVTKSSHDTHGGLFRITAENDGPGAATFRYGAPVDEDWSVQLRARGVKRDGYPLNNGGTDEEDGWTSLRVGFRMDGNVGADDSLMFDGSWSTGENKSLINHAVYGPPYQESISGDGRAESMHFISRWNHDLGDGDDLRVQINYDRQVFGAIINYQVDTVELDFQHHLKTGTWNEIVWGAGYRLIMDSSSEGLVFLAPASRNLQLLSAFAQDTITLSDSFRLTLGVKLEHNDFSGLEIQPSIRFAWTPDTNQTLWAAVSRAVRTPARIDADGNWIGTTGVPLASPLPGIVNIRGNRDIDAEELLAFELGYRIKPSDTLLIEIATFFNLHSNYIDKELGEPTLGSFHGLPAIMIPTTFVNNQDGDSYGVELNLRWRPLEWLQMDANYSYLDVNLPITIAGDPHHQAHLRLGADLSDDLRANTALYYVDNTPGFHVGSFLRWDINLAWQINETFSVSAGVQDLLDNRHAEAKGFGAPVWEIRRRVWLSLELSF